MTDPLVMVAVCSILWVFTYMWEPGERPKPTRLEELERWNDAHEAATSEGLDEPAAVKRADQALYTFKRMRGTIGPVSEVMKEFYIPQPSRRPEPQCPNPMRPVRY